MIMRDQLKPKDKLENILNHRGKRADVLPFDSNNRRNGMLVLTRHVTQTIVVGDDTTITVLGIQGNQVRLGINAPKEIPVHRAEIYRKIQQEKKAQGVN